MVFAERILSRENDFKDAKQLAPMISVFSCGQSTFDCAPKSYSEL